MKRLTREDLERIMALSAACEAAQAKQIEELRAKDAAEAAERQRLLADISQLLQENEKHMQEFQMSCDMKASEFDEITRRINESQQEQNRLLRELTRKDVYNFDFQ